jgi:hypothetical protein
VNRAQKMLSVLIDGHRHSRHDIFNRVGFMLTNNAASELRRLGFDVLHSNEGRVDFYELVTPLAEPTGAPYPRTSVGSASGAVMGGQSSSPARLFEDAA